jgi:hypothetical protein
VNLFDRAPTEYRHILDEALRIIPPKVFESITPRFMCGVDPAFVGLHHYDKTGAASYARTCHAVFPWHSSDGEPRVVLPTIYKKNMVEVAIHEVGHLFDFATGFSLEAPETTWYSKTNRLERIAEAFETILMPPSGKWRDYSESEAFRPLRTAMGLI